MTAAGGLVCVCGGGIRGWRSLAGPQKSLGREGLGREERVDRRAGGGRRGARDGTGARNSVVWVEGEPETVGESGGGRARNSGERSEEKNSWMGRGARRGEQGPSRALIFDIWMGRGSSRASAQSNGEREGGGGLGLGVGLFVAGGGGMKGRRHETGTDKRWRARRVRTRGGERAHAQTQIQTHTDTHRSSAPGSSSCR